ncbi:multidrug ABC transporter ATP-binding protein [Acrocarpospora phusangensis]|uniref:Multidrug ABC transporter ATP-binding protein n=1 Tax=Acrocarpospora phusangensis TaxID=1070424 RepID=A0A919QJU5_9ACTN|nr:ABC transporter ATP-binding protein [Acrocarpospora phusangensis]GIH28993.1 multidrug ABC transporter ATP-binding protein [Acrocarpospora phusangensis]
MGGGRDVLWRTVRGQRRDVLVGSLLGACHQAGEVAVPVLIGVVIDEAVGPGDLTALLTWLAVLAAVYVALSMSFRYGARAGERAAEQAGHELRLQIVRRVLDPRGGAEHGRLPGALATIATEDAKRVGAVNMAAMMGIGALAGVLVGAVVLLRISLPLGLLVLLGTPLLLFAGHLLSKPLERRSEAEQERAAHASGVAADLVSGLRVLKGIGAEVPAVDRYRRTSRESLAATLRAARAEAWQYGMVLALTGGFIAIVALIGGRLALQGDITLGQLVSAVGLALFLLGPLEVFSWVNAELAQGRASATRIADVLNAPTAIVAGTGSDGLFEADTPPHPDPRSVRADRSSHPNGGPPEADAAPGPHGDGRSAMAGVGSDRAHLGSFPRPVRGELRLRSVRCDGLALDLHVSPGEVLGVVATDPAYATVLVRCLGRHVDPEAGVIELDGVPFTDVDPAELRTRILVAEHDADLFEGTLRGNVAASEPMLDRVLVAAGVDEVARGLPLGVDTPLIERGRSLSGGQRQRVALARALAADRQVLVLHDPTTAVDTVTEARIADGLREIRQGRTTIVVTTSPALLAVTDRVVLLNDGRVADAAPHAELVRRNTVYRAAVLS